MAGQKTNSSIPIVTPAIRDAADPNGVTASSTSAGHATATRRDDRRSNGPARVQLPGAGHDRTQQRGKPRPRLPGPWRQRLKQGCDRVGHTLGFTSSRRQNDVESCATAGGADAATRSAVPFDDRLDDGKTQAAAGEPDGAGLIDLVEAVEHQRQVFGRNARAGILDAQPHAGRRARDAVTATRPPSGVWRTALATRFCSGLLEPPAIAAHALGARLDRRRHRDAALAGDDAVAFGDPLEQPRHGHLDGLDRDAAAFEPRQVEQVADDGLQAQRLFGDDADVAFARAPRRGRRSGMLRVSR